MEKIAKLLIFLILLTAVGFLSWINVPHYLSEHITETTGVPSSIHHFSLGLAKIRLQNIHLENPQKTLLPTALRVRNLEIDAPFLRYFGNPIVIEEVKLDNVYINIQLYNNDQTEGNWQTLIANMGKEQGHELSYKRQVHIKKLVLTKIQIDLVLADGKFRSLSPIDRLEFDNITSAKGIPTQEISQIIVQNMMHSIFLQKGLKSAIQAPANVLQGLFKPLLGF